jgi:ABC-type transport system involved in cytochrome c biogenesis permease subunit
MNWIYFPLYALFTAGLYALGVVLLYVASDAKKIFKVLGNASLILGIGALSLFIALLWLNLGRPPMRTLGETRLWYSFFLIVIGYIIYLRWGYRWFLIIILFFACIFLLINYLHPEAHEKTLMPALQSPWFIPHVIVYILSYALLAISSLIGIYGLFFLWKKKPIDELIKLSDNLVYIGFSLLTLGLLFGALWAKEAWGNYWTWDPKETWAFLTWLVYLIYIHYRYFHPSKVKTQFWILSVIYIVLLVAWFGINYLPSAQNSVHVYAQ